MLITWTCRRCSRRLAKIEVSEEDSRVAALTAHAGDDIIEYDRAGDLVVRLLCEDCLEVEYPEEDSEIDFLREPELH